MVLRDFALIGDDERQLLIQKHIPAVLIDFYLGDESPLFPVHLFLPSSLLCSLWFLTSDASRARRRDPRWVRRRTPLGWTS